MKSHDFGQFLFNSSIFNELQLSRLITVARKSKPTLAAKALFLRLVSAKELDDAFMDAPFEMSEIITRKDFFSSEYVYNERFYKICDDIVRGILNSRQIGKTNQLEDSQSLWIIQELLDSCVMNFIRLENVLDEYYRLEIPPIVQACSAYYDVLNGTQNTDYSFALDVIQTVHSFLSESLGTTIIILPPTEIKEKSWFGASVKIVGSMPVVVGILADEKTFLKLAKRYERFVETLEDSFDGVAELLNVFTGQFTVKIASSLGVEEEPEPPRYGQILKNIPTIRMLADFGNFYLYVDQEEIF